MEYLKHFSIPREYDLTNPYTIKSISAVVADMTDSAVYNAIIRSAQESGVTDLYMMDKKFVSDALREKLEREKPKPLTIEELRQMDGQPVWIDDWWEDSHGWELSMDAADYFEGEKRTEKEYGSIWIAYRYKPKEDVK